MQVRGEPGREAQEAEHHVLDPLAHVALATRLDLVRLLAGQAQQDRHVVRAERPQGILVRAELAEVEPVAVDVEDPAEVAVVDQLLELDDAGVVLEQVADHERPPRRRGGADDGLRSRRRLRHRLLDEAVLAGLEHADGERLVGRDGRGQHDGVDRAVGQHLVEVGGEARGGEHGRDARAVRLRGVAAPDELGVRQCRDVAGDVRAPVAETRDGDAESTTRGRSNMPAP